MVIFTLFDKSFLQSLSLDESVWFDNYFNPIICPIFYVETLADLGKNGGHKRTGEEEVRIIAAKFPDISCTPVVHHKTLCIGELLGERIPMSGDQVVRPGGRPVRASGTSGVVFEKGYEADAFTKWHNEQFHEIERRFGRVWRNMISNLDLQAVGAQFRKLGIDGKTCKSLHEAKVLADRIVSGRDRASDRMSLALRMIGVDQVYHEAIHRKWALHNYPAISEYAPYSAHVFSVELFFQIALAANLISSDRPSNRMDVAYFWYLPFCKVFVSSDKLHRKCASLFLRGYQDFFWGPDLKAGLREIDAHFREYPTDVKNKGIMSFANCPPRGGDFLIARIWDRHLPGWRAQPTKNPVEDNPKHDDLLSHLTQFTEAPILGSDEVNFDIRNPDAMAIRRMVRKKKGSWWQLPKDLKPKRQ